MSIVQVQQDNDTYKVICQKCEHYIRVDKGSAENYENNPETFECELCYVKPGEPKHLTRKFEQCSTCLQVYDSHSSCECEPQHSTIEIIYDPKNIWWKHNRVDEKQEMVKAQREFNHIVNNKRVEQEKRNKHVEELLIENNKLLKKLLESKLV